jgi:hypothetical protein
VGLVLFLQLRRERPSLRMKVKTNRVVLLRVRVSLLLRLRVTMDLQMRLLCLVHRLECIKLRLEIRSSELKSAGRLSRRFLQVLQSVEAAEVGGCLQQRKEVV